MPLPSSPLPTRIRIDRFGDTWRTHVGANAIRRQIRREQEAALARYDADPSPENKAAFARLADTEAEVGRRLAEQHSKRRAA